LVVGASYVALECAGFLTALGYPVEVMVRSILLRGFDQEIAGKIKNYMEELHTKFINECVPVKAEKLDTGKIKVTWKKASDKDGAELFSDEFDTVLVATGRYADTKNLNLEALGVKLDRSGKIICDETEKSSVENIFALGDCSSGKMELTPPAIMAGKLLASRLLNGGTRLMNYDNIATTVFTPIEYGAIGLTEEECYKKFGEENVDCYHSYFKPLEWNFMSEHTDDSCYIKLLVNKLDNNRVIGFHFLGPHAGEVTQGYSVAFNMGATKEDFFNTVGIHPTCSEVIVTLKQTKKDSPEGQNAGC